MSTRTSSFFPTATCRGATISTAEARLSEEALAEFTHFFLETCVDQVKFMEELVQPDKLRARVKLWADEEIATDALPAKASIVLDAILYRGELPRGDVAGLLDTSARSARRAISALMKRGVVTATTTRSDLRIAFPAALAARWMPDCSRISAARLRRDGSVHPQPRSPRSLGLGSGEVCTTFDTKRLNEQVPINARVLLRILRGVGFPHSDRKSHFREHVLSHPEPESGPATAGLSQGRQGRFVGRGEEGSSQLNENW